MKTKYRKYAIYSEASLNNKGIFDVRVVLQKIGTAQISSHYPSCSSLFKGVTEIQGTSAGKDIIDLLLNRRLGSLM